MLRAIGFKIPDHARVIFNDTGTPYNSGDIDRFVYPDGSNVIGGEPLIVAFDGAEDAPDYNDVLNIFSQRKSLIERYKNGDISVVDEIKESSIKLYAEIENVEHPDRLFLFDIQDLIQRGGVPEIFSSPEWTPRIGIERTLERFEGLYPKNFNVTDYAMLVYGLPKAKSWNDARVTLLKYYDSIAKK